MVSNEEKIVNFLKKSLIKMKMLSTIFLFVFGILLISIVKANLPFINETFDNSLNWNLSNKNISLDANDLSGCYLNQSSLACTPLSPNDPNKIAIYVHKLPNLSTSVNKFSCQWDLNFSVVGNNNDRIWDFSAENITTTANEDISTKWSLRAGTNNNIFLDNNNGGFNIDTGLYYQSRDTNIIKMVFWLNESISFYINNSYKGNLNSSENPKISNVTYWRFKSYNKQTSRIDNFLCYNGTSLNAPTVTNVSITPLPLGANTDAKGYANVSDFENDTIGGNQTYWWVNQTLITEANNSFNLKSGNVTLNANITFSVRFNDTYEWSSWLNSSRILVGDTTAPVIDTCSIQYASLTSLSGNTNIFNCNISDTGSNIQTVSFDLNGTINKTINFVFIPNLSVNISYKIFQSAEALLEGGYSIMNVTTSDTSSNKLINSTNFHFVVVSPPSSPVVLSIASGSSEPFLVKTDCKVFIEPEILDLTIDDNVQLLKINNLDTISYSPVYNLEKNISNYIELRGNINQLILPNQKQEVTVVYNNLVANIINTKLTLTDNVCKDIGISLNLYPETVKLSFISATQNFLNEKITIINIFNSDFLVRNYHLIFLYVVIFLILLYFSKINIITKIPLSIILSGFAFILTKLFINVIK